MAFSKWRTLRFVTCLSVLLLACATVAGAQGTGRIEGRVVKDGKGIAGVVVLINETKAALVTDENGRVTFESVPARSASYLLIMTLGENTLTRPVIVTAGQTNSFEQEVDWDVGVVEKVTVTAAAARAAKIVDAPAAVTSVPEEQIEREASHGQLPKILEFTPGAEVTQSGLYDFNFNTRGFNSSLNRRVSTYIDGRDVGVVLLGAQEWSALSMLDDLASLEFIRGPSAALYGANASSGVVNISTKAPRDSQGSVVRLTGGELDTLNLDFRHAGELGGGWFYKVLGGLRNTGDFSISRNPDVTPQPEYSEYCLLIGETDCLPKEKTLFIEQDNKIRFGSFRADRYLSDDKIFTIEAGTTSIEGPVFQTGIGRVQVLDVKRPFYRFGFSSPRWNVLAHYSSRDGDQVNLTEALIRNFSLITDTKRYGVEAQGNWNFAAGRGRFVIGAAHTEERVDTTDPATGNQTVVYQPIETDRQAVFSQLDWSLNEKVKLVFAGRVDKNTLHTTQFSPKAAVVYSMTPKQSLRFTFNEAFQVANYSEFFLHTRISRFPLLGFTQTICSSPVLPQPVDCGITEDAPILAVGNDDLQLEETSAWEVGYSGLLLNKVFVTLDYYNSENKNFITDLIQQVGTSLGDLNGCIDPRTGVQSTDRRVCPVNADYQRWIGPDIAETTELFPGTSVAQALRNAVDRSVGGGSLGFRLARDLDGSTVVVGRTYSNIGAVDTQGVDLGVQYFINEAWNLQASYSWFDFEILSSAEFSAADVAEVLLPNTPEHKASLSVSFVKDRWAASLSGRWVDDFRWAAGVFQGDVPAYSTVDMSGSYRFSDNISLGVNVANLRDSVHRQTFGGDLLSRRALTNLTFSW